MGCKVSCRRLDLNGCDSNGLRSVKLECLLTSSESHQQQRRTKGRPVVCSAPRSAFAAQTNQIGLEGSCQPLNPLMFASLTDVREESRHKTARRETKRHQRAPMRKRAHTASSLRSSPGQTSRSFVATTPAKPHPSAVTAATEEEPR